MDGKTNNTGLLTLATGNAVTTTLFDGRIGNESLLFFTPVTDAAEADSAPYGAFQDTTDQTAANTTTAYAVTLNTTDYSNGVYLSNSSRLNVRNYGIYNIQFSIQLKNTTNDTQDADIWFRKNGTDVAGSNSRFGMQPRKSSGDPSHSIAALNYFAELNANDYVEIMWRVSDVGVVVGVLHSKFDPAGKITTGSVALDLPAAAQIANGGAGYILVNDDPLALWEGKVATGPPVVPAIGLNASHANGTRTSATVTSPAYLDFGTEATTSTLNFQILGLVRRVDNEIGASCRLNVRFNVHQYNTVGTTGI